jgi:acetyl-CoA synthetase
METSDWSGIRAFTSTGESSNPEDMLYLMYLANYKPVIEYCGGTEIGGAYVSSTIIENNSPSVFNIPTMGTSFVLLDEDNEISDKGEVALFPPILGLSTQILNADHDKIYYAGMPTINNKILRRHGDQLQHFPNDGYCVLGRVDDTMNLGGIKISSVEIERVIAKIDEIAEVAAVAITPENHGPSQLILYIVPLDKNLDKLSLQKTLQQKINTELNPLFRIHDIIFLDEMPKTASNKIMRRKLRDSYK